jgi:hypothetical protein
LADQQTTSNALKISSQSLPCGIGADGSATIAVLPAPTLEQPEPGGFGVPMGRWRGVTAQ